MVPIPSNLSTLAHAANRNQTLSCTSPKADLVVIDLAADAHRPVLPPLTTLRHAARSIHGGGGEAGGGETT